MSQDEVLNITLSDDLREHVFQRASEGRYSTISEYIGELIRGDQRRRSQKRLESLVLEGLESAPREMTPGDWEELKGRVWDRHRESSTR